LLFLQLEWTVTLNVKYFAPEELHVKTVGSTVEIKAKHEEKPDDAGAIRYTVYRIHRVIIIYDSLSKFYFS